MFFYVRKNCDQWRDYFGYGLILFGVTLSGFLGALAVFLFMRALGYPSP
jgi:hypothetical protein